MALLEWDELRLTLDESRQIAALRHARDDEAIRLAHEKVVAAGRPTLMLERSRREGSLADAGEAGNHAVLFDYFAGQLFADLPEPTQLLLATLALLPRLTPEQACDLGNSSEAGTLLEDLYRRRMFVEKREAFYQFHDLFRTFLVKQFDVLQEWHEAKRIRSVATGILLHQGQMEDAFALACAAELWERAEKIALDHAPVLFEQGRAEMLRDWLGALPEGRLEDSAWLVLWLGVALSSKSPALARARFEHAFERFEAANDATGQLLSCGGMITTCYLEFDDMTRLVPLDPAHDQVDGPQVAAGASGLAEDQRRAAASRSSSGPRRSPYWLRAWNALAPCWHRMYR